MDANTASAKNLILDIGNSTAKVAVFQNGTIADSRRIRTEDLADFIARDKMIEGCSRGIISSTVDLPEQTTDLLADRGIAAICLSADTPLPFANDYHTPHTIGPDRLAAVAGALALWPGENVLVVDAGSCITYEVLTADRHYIGGNIAPGLRMRFEAMHEHTARLPLLDAGGDIPPIGHDTQTAMRAGVIRGLQYEIEGYIHYLKDTYGEIRTVLTGGDSEIIKKTLTTDVAQDASLVLRGLDNILRYNETLS